MSFKSFKTVLFLLELKDLILGAHANLYFSINSQITVFFVHHRTGYTDAFFCQVRAPSVCDIGPLRWVGRPVTIITLNRYVHHIVK